MQPIQGIINEEKYLQQWSSNFQYLDFNDNKLRKLSIQHCMSYIFRFGTAAIFVSQKILSDKHTERRKNQTSEKKKKKGKIPIDFTSQDQDYSGFSCCLGKKKKKSNLFNPSVLPGHTHPSCLFLLQSHPLSEPELPCPSQAASGGIQDTRTYHGMCLWALPCSRTAIVRNRTKPERDPIQNTPAYSQKNYFIITKEHNSSH